MKRCTRKDSRLPSSCACLVDAFRMFPAQVDISEGCASPDCLVKSLDSVTLRQFLEAIAGPDGAGDVDNGTERVDVPIFRAIEKRLARQKSRRPPK
jgi:hypothetical protein